MEEEEEEPMPLKLRSICGSDDCRLGMHGAGRMLSCTPSSKRVESLLSAEARVESAAEGLKSLKETRRRCSRLRRRM